MVLLIALSFLLSGCAKLDYLLDQGMGQLKIQSKARKNTIVLKDVRISDEKKEKIKLVQKYKKYFYQYFARAQTDIYSKTTMLDQDAVSYLIIASKFNEVKAKDHCFWLMGCFPYLGFFSEKDSLEYKAKLEDKGMFVYKRPVYAYSTLGYFTDTILSSFFYYDEFDLAELIFHELFHTIFFIEDKVELNENLANYFGKELALEYFKDRPDILKNNEKKLERKRKFSKVVVSLAKQYESRLKTERPTSKQQTQSILRSFLEKTFYPKIRNACQSLGIKKCKALNPEKEWNNASFAAYLTYQKKMVPIRKLRDQLKLSLKEYFLYIENSYENYDGDNFGKDLFAEVK